MIRHEDATFENATILASGQEFVRCTFRRSTIIVRDALMHAEGCGFEECNFHLDLMLANDSLQAIAMTKGIIALLEKQAADKAVAANPVPTEPTKPMTPPKITGVATAKV